MNNIESKVFTDEREAGGIEPREGCYKCMDSAGMIVTVANKLKVERGENCWLGGRLPAEYCPFCGRKLGG